MVAQSDEGIVLNVKATLKVNLEFSGNWCSIGKSIFFNKKISGKMFLSTLFVFALITCDILNLLKLRINCLYSNDL